MLRNALTLSVRLLLVLCVLVPVTAQAPLQFDDYCGKLMKLIEVKDDKELDRLVKTNQLNTILQYEFLVRDLVYRKKAELRGTLDMIQASWKRAVETSTLEKVERFWNSVDDERNKQYDRGVQSLNRLYANVEAARKGKREEIIQVADEAMAVANSFRELGHPIRAAQAWHLRSQIFASVLPGPTIEESNEGVTAMGEFKSLREQWEFTKDLDFPQNVAWMKAEISRIEQRKKEGDKRVAEGYKAEVRGADSFLLPSAKEEIQTLEFKPLPHPGPDMFTRGGPIAPLWHTVYVADPGQKYEKLYSGPSKITQFAFKDLWVVRPAVSKYGVSLKEEADPKKMVYEEIKVGSNTQKLEPTVVYLGEKKTQPYAFFFFVGSNAELVNGMKQNLQPTPGNAGLRFKSAASWTCTLAGEQVTLFDDNCNGKLFEDDPLVANIKDRTLQGPKVEVPVPAFDSMQIGKGPVVPFSSWVQIGANWYHIRPPEAGKDGTLKISARQTNPEYFKTGTLQLKWTGPPAAKPEALVVRCKGDYSNANFDLGSGKPVTVPVGKYDIAWGRIVSGKGEGAIVAQIYQGKSESVVVEAGKAAELKIGGPFRLDISPTEKNTDEFEINALDFRVYGVANEQYGRMNGAPPICEVYASKTKDMKGAKLLGEFVPLEDPELLNKLANQPDYTVLGTELAFFPILKGASKFSLKFKPPFPGAFYAGTTTRHKLFGKLEPVWKDK